jgi:2-C-methyl-D-erythritol 4-phosphate cytidylyltransferase
VKLSAIVPVPAEAAQRPAALFTPIAGQPVLARLVRSLIGAFAVADVLVLVDDRLTADVRGCLAGLPVVVAGAGESPSTAECLVAAVPLLRAHGATHALVGDHRYPLTPPDLVRRLADALTGGAELAVPVLPVTDSVKLVDGQGTIVSTVDRSGLQLLQYPRGVSLERLAAAEGDLDVALGADVTTLAGDADAIAFDLPGDAALLEAIIACRS